MRLRTAALRGSPRRWGLDTAGAAAVELALITPFLLTLILGGVDFGALFYITQTVAAATRAGAEYARNSPICQAGIQVLNTPQISAACTTGIENAVQDSGSFSPALTFPTAPVLKCYCDGGVTPNAACTIANGANYSCATNGKGNNEVFVSVSASRAVTSIVPWPGFPATLNGVTELRLQ